MGVWGGIVDPRLRSEIENSVVEDAKSCAAGCEGGCDTCGLGFVCERIYPKGPTVMKELDVRVLGMWACEGGAGV
jgi:hypothetical protein